MSTDKPLPEAVREQREAFWECVRPLLYPEERGFIAGKLDVLVSAVWEAAAQQERALRDALYELTAVGYLFLEEYNRGNVAITTWQRMGARLGLAHDLLHPVDESVTSHPPPTPEDR